jgi:hypothetical protein
VNEKLINVNIDINFCIIDDINEQDINNEFESLSENNQDPLTSWIKLAKAKGNIENNDILLNLVVELHRKLDKIENLIEKKTPTYINLKQTAKIIGIGHNYFQLDTTIKEENMYARIDMPVFPKRFIPIMFSHVQDNIYKIDLMHNRDTLDYDSYIATRERSLIREKRNNK